MNLKKYITNYYAIVGVAFLIWMILIDKNDVISQFKLNSSVNVLRDQRDFYLSKIDIVQEEREELMNNDELLEKFAREKYLMKKPTEDIYYIETVEE